MIIQHPYNCISTVMYSTTHSATIACDWIFNVLSRSRLKAMAGNDEIDETRFYSA